MAYKILLEMCSFYNPSLYSWPISPSFLFYFFNQIVFLLGSPTFHLCHSATSHLYASAFLLAPIYLTNSYLLFEPQFEVTSSEKPSLITEV